MPTGVGPVTATIATSEALAAGALVNVYLNSSTPNVRNADATTNGKPCDGFVLSAFPSGNALVYFDDMLTGLTGLTVGAMYYLATTAGGVTATPPSASGNIVQKIGKAISTTCISFDPNNNYITLA